MKRKLAAHDNLKVVIEQTGDKFHVKEGSNFRTLELDFTLGVTFEYSLADGTELSVSKSSFEVGAPSDSNLSPVVTLLLLSCVIILSPRYTLHISLTLSLSLENKFICQLRNQFIHIKG